MIEIALQRRGSTLEPVSTSDEQEVHRLPERRIIMAAFSIDPPKSLPRWYRAMVQLLCEATGRWPSREIAHKELMIQAGMFESMVISANGDARLTPMSTAEWEIHEWRAYLDRVIPIIADKYLNSVPWELKAKVSAMIGIRYEEAWKG